MTSLRSVLGGCFAYTLLFLYPATAHAQFGATPFSDPATGEKYRVEGAINFWNPPLSLQVSSESLGQAGTTVDAVKDLGLFGPKVQQAFQDMGVIEFQSADPDDLAAADEEIARDLDRRRRSPGTDGAGVTDPLAEIDPARAAEVRAAIDAGPD